MDEIKQNNSPDNSQCPGESQQVPKAPSTSSGQADLTSQQANDDKLSACEKQRDEYLAGWQRAKADFINYKKDEGKRFESLIRFANEDILEELIGVLDSFDLGLAAMEKAGPVEKGVYMVRSKLDNVLKQRGLEI